MLFLISVCKKIRNSCWNKWFEIRIMLKAISFCYKYRITSLWQKVLFLDFLLQNFYSAAIYVSLTYTIAVLELHSMCCFLSSSKNWVAGTLFWVAQKTFYGSAKRLNFLPCIDFTFAPFFPAVQIILVMFNKS